MLLKVTALITLLLSLLAIANAASVYRKSYYLEPTSRVNIDKLTEGLQHKNTGQLIRLNQYLAKISRSDHGILLIMSDQFRTAILFLAVCLMAAVILLAIFVYRLLRQNDPPTKDTVKESV